MDESQQMEHNINFFFHSILHKIKIMNIKQQEQKKKKWNTKTGISRAAIINFLTAYITDCNIHGLHYIIKKDLTIIEKCLWMICVITSLCCCILIGLESLDHYFHKGTVVGLERDYHYWNTTMPSITICPLVRLSETLYSKYSQENNLNKNEHEILFDFLEILANTTYTNVERIPVNNEIDSILDKLNIKAENYMELIYNLTENVSVQFSKDINGPSKIRAISGDFIIATQQILTEYGLCYMTNSMLSPKYSSSYMINGKLMPSDIEKNPLYVKAKKCSYFDNNIDYSVSGFDISGINIFLHSPYDVMKIDQNLGFTTDLLQLKVECMEIVTEENFEKDATIDNRKCRFQHENNLTHFPIFTRNLCYQECRLNLIYKTCKCIPHFYPNNIKNPKPVCNYRILKKCLTKNKDFFTKLYRVNKDGNKHEIKCYCQQNCEDSLVNIRKKLPTMNINILVGGNGVFLDMIHLPKERLKRQIIFSLSDLLVSLGSTAGLFLGISVLSLMEILYYITLKLLCIKFINRN